jgi:glycosyltransferase involved in cell wall biosynthesis
MEISASSPNVVAIIPFYNGSEFIARSLRSVFSQTVPFKEVIVVNDGSKPEELAALRVIAKNYPCRIIDKENGGQGSARNVGVRASSAEFICFLDQDDFFLETHVETLIKALPKQDPRLGYVYADFFEADGAGRILRMAAVKDFAKEHPKRSVFRMISADMFVLPSASLIARKAFEDVGGFDEQFMGFEDDDLFIRIFRAGYTNYFVDEAVTVWCIHTASTSFGIRMSRSRFKFFKKLAVEFPDEPLRGHFYLRDYLVPRFGKYFVNDVIKARSRGENENYVEVMGILDSYGAIIEQNPFVGRMTKIGFMTTRFLLRYTPDFLLRGVVKVIDGRLLIRLRKLFH